MRDINIRSYLPGDESAILDLFHTVFGKEKNPDVWRWQFERVGVEPAIMLAFEGGDLVAQYAAVPADITDGKRRWRAMQIVDAMSHPAVRGKGIFTRTAEAFFEYYKNSVDVIYGIPGTEHFQMGSSKLGYKGIGRIVEFSVDLVDWKTVPSANFPKPDDARWVKIEKDRPYLDWRYRASPHPYEVLQSKRLFGLRSAWVQVRQLNGRCMWMDWGGNPGSLPSLMEKVREWSSDNGIGRVVAWAQPSSQLGIMLRLGGWNEAEKNDVMLTVKPFNPSLDVSSWDGRFLYAQGDFDLA